MTQFTDTDHNVYTINSEREQEVPMREDPSCERASLLTHTYFGKSAKAVQCRKLYTWQHQGVSLKPL